MLRRVLGRVALPLRGLHRRGNVMMIHVGRSGSTVVGDLLAQHPRIAWDGEIYQRVFQRRENPDRSLPPLPDVDPVRFLVERSNRAFCRYYGFEVKPFHLRALGTDLGPYLDALEETLGKLRFVVLERRNTLRVVVSTLAARRSNVWHRRREEPRPSGRVRVDVDAVFVNRAHARLHDLLREFDRDFQHTERLLRDRPALHLTYEDDVEGDPLRAYGKICRHLGVAPAPATTRFFPTNPHPLSDLVENFDEVRSALLGTGFEWMLDG